jgi:hypothetical protein
MKSRNPKLRIFVFVLLTGFSMIGVGGCATGGTSTHVYASYGYYGGYYGPYGPYYGGDVIVGVPPPPGGVAPNPPPSRPQPPPRASQLPSRPLPAPAPRPAPRAAPRGGGGRR